MYMTRVYALEGRKEILLMRATTKVSWHVYELEAEGVNCMEESDAISSTQHPQG